MAKLELPVQAPPAKAEPDSAPAQRRAAPEPQSAEQVAELGDLAEEIFAGWAWNG